MNYKKIHDNIIDRAKNRDIEGYVEKHHIVPKCLGGLDNIENIVKLTAREHFIIHKLLVKIYPPNNDSLIYAVWAMACLLDNQYRKNKRYNIGAREYQILKIEMSEATKKRLKENNIWRGKSHSEKTRKKMSTSAKNRSITKENEDKRRKGISKSNKGKKKSSEHIENIRKAKLGSKNPMFGKISPRSKKVFQYDLNKSFIKEWSNAKKAADSLNLNYKAINLCCNKKSKSSGGYFWTYNKLK